MGVWLVWLYVSSFVCLGFSVVDGFHFFIVVMRTKEATFDVCFCFGGWMDQC